MLHKKFLGFNVLAFFNALIIFLGLIQLINFLKLSWYLPVSPMPSGGIIHISLTTPEVDLLLFVAITFLTIPLTILAIVKNPKIVGSLLKRTILALLIILIFVELVSLTGWLLYSTYKKNSLAWHFINIETQLFYVFSYYSAEMFLLTSFSWILILILKLPKNFSLKAYKKLGELAVESYAKTLFKNRLHLLIIISTSFLTTATLAFYPYLPSLNPSGRLVGVDTKYYLNELKDALKGSPVEALAYFLWKAMGGSRPLYLLPNYFICLLGFDVEEVVMFQPLILLPLTLLSVYLFAYEGLHNSEQSTLAALLTSTSFYVTVGMFAAFYANLFALFFGFLSLTLLIRYLQPHNKKSSIKTLLTSSLLLSTVIFIHPWAWGFFIAVIIVYPIFMFIMGIPKEELKRRIFPLGFLLLVNFSVDAFKRFILHSLSGVEAIYQVSKAFLSLENFSKFWLHFMITFRSFSSGFYTNMLLIGLAFIGTLFLILRRNKSDFSCILLSWLFLISILLPFADYVAQPRIIFNLPVSILAAIGLTTLLTTTNKLEERTSSKNHLITILLLTLIILANFTYAFRCITLNVY
ncbi:MAG: hypothetical protein ACKD6N_06455 [Candidatus Bathyarchaeota archaeon]